MRIGTSEMVRLDKRGMKGLGFEERRREGRENGKRTRRRFCECIYRGQES